MSIPKTYEQTLALKLNPRNYSDILPIIYKLRTRENEEYVPQAFDRIVYASLAVGENGTAAIFSGLSQDSYAKGQAITLSGAATYKLVNGATVLEVKPAIKLTAQIDIARSGPPLSLPAYQVECLTTQITDAGVFSFDIPAEVTQRLSSGKHYVYIDAHSPDNAPVRLVAEGGGAVNNERNFTITV